MKKKAAPEKTPAQTLHWKYALPFIVIVLIRTLASFDATSGLWGLNVSGFLSNEVTLVLAVLSLSLAVPTVGMRLNRMVSFTGDALFPEERGKRILVHAVIAGACGILFWKLFVPFSFLGDGVHVVRALFRYAEDAGFSYGTLWNEPLTVLTIVTLIGLFVPHAGGDATVQLQGYTEVFLVVSFVVGAVYVFTVMMIAHRAARTSLQRMALTGSIFGTAGMLFYFGYVEYYAFLYLFGTMFLLVGMVEMQMERFPKFSTIVFACGVAFHLSALVFLPAWVFLLWRKKFMHDSNGLRKLLIANAIFLTLAFVFYIALNAADANTFFIPLTSETSSFTLLSPQHLLDVLNNLALGAPVSLAMIFCFFVMKKTDYELSRSTVFAVHGVLYWLALCVGHSAIARDWDVYALLGTTIAVAAFAMVLSIKQEHVRSYFLGQLAVQPLILIIPWIAVNTNFFHSLDRFTALTELYVPILPKEVSAGHFETIRSVFSATNNREGEIATIIRVANLTGDPYEYYKLTRAFESATTLSPEMLAALEASLGNILQLPDSVRNAPVGKDEHAQRTTLNEIYVNLVKAATRLMPVETRPGWAENVLKPIIGKERTSFDIAYYLGNRHFAAKQYERAVEWYEKALVDSAARKENHGQTMSYLFNAIGVSWANLGDREKAMDALRKSVRYPETNAVTWSDYGFASYTTMLFGESERAFSEALKRDSTITNALYCLGKIYLIDPAKHEKGRALLTRFLALEQGTPRADDAREVLSMNLSQLRQTTFR